MCCVFLLVATWFFSSSSAMVTGRVALELPVPKAVVKAFAMFQMNLRKVEESDGGNEKRI